MRHPYPHLTRLLYGLLVVVVVLFIVTVSVMASVGLFLHPEQFMGILAAALSIITLAYAVGYSIERWEL